MRITFFDFPYSYNIAQPRNSRVSPETVQSGPLSIPLHTGLPVCEETGLSLLQARLPHRRPTRNSADDVSVHSALQIFLIISLRAFFSSVERDSVQIVDTELCRLILDEKPYCQSKKSKGTVAGLPQTHNHHTYTG